MLFSHAARSKNGLRKRTRYQVSRSFSEETLHPLSSAVLRWLLPAVIWLIPLHCQCWRPAEVYLWAAREIRSGEFGPHAYDDAAVSQEIGRITRGQVRDRKTD